MGQLDADVCIVGGGYTGLWTAVNLKQRAPELDVALIEADVCGSGASGRNGGFAMSLWHHFVALERVCGSAEALRLARASAAAVRDIGAFCAAHRIEAEYRHDGWMWTATNRSQVGAWESTMTAIARHGEAPFQRLPPDRVAARTGSPKHLAGVFEPTSATVQPALLARGLRRVAGDLGVRIYEHSPMVALERSRPAVVRTPHGAVGAGVVVIAMNAWAASLRELRNAIVVVGSDIVLTEPLPGQLDPIGWDDGMSISDSRLMVHYYRTTADRRLAFGKGGGELAYGARLGALGHGRCRDPSAIATTIATIYPQLGAVALARCWSGPIDRAVDGLPFFTTLGRADLICGLGYSGNGVGPSVLGGRILAAMALGADDEWARCGLVREPPRGLPPEPVRYLGGRLVRGAVARKERAEDDGREPSLLDRRLAALAPAGLVPLD